MQETSTFQTAATFGNGSPEQHLNLAPVLPDDTGWTALGRTGYIPLAPILPMEFIDALPDEVDRLISAGHLRAPADRVIDGRPTEHLLNVRATAGGPRASSALAASPRLTGLFGALQRVGEAYNARRTSWISAGLLAPEEAPEVSIDGMELNVNRVTAGWTGLHPHQDQNRFTEAARRVPTTSLQHQLQAARVLTISGYARPVGPDGGRLDDLGGALTFFVRAHERGPADGAIHDVVAARHGTGAIFLARTTHGVSRMNVPGSVRYSFQTFFPAQSVWDKFMNAAAA